jgi:hypothetical protein
MQQPRNDYDVTNRIQTTDTQSVQSEVLRLCNLLYPGETAAPLTQAFTDFDKLYAGTYPGYRACDTDYHNLQHVLDVTLAMARLMDGYERSRQGTPPLGISLFQLGIIASLFHDIGYLRTLDDDVAPCGAFYTAQHVSRGAAFIRGYLPTIGLGDQADACAELLHFTGFEKRVAEILIEDPVLRLIGSLLGSADLIAQMADRCYLEKCRDRLYPEFVAGGMTVQKKPDGSTQVLFTSGEDLVKKTPLFFQSAVERLETDLGGAYNYAASHFGGFNLYIHAATRNVHFAKQVGMGGRYSLRRTPPDANPQAADSTLQ